MYGFVKVCAATPELKVADTRFNAEKIIEIIKGVSGVQVLVFPELSVCGYTCGDLFNQQALVSGAEQALEKICAATRTKRTLVFVGAPVARLGRLYNCAVAICDGRILGVIPKTFIPSYGEFYERRNFTPAGPGNSQVTLCGQTVDFMPWRARPS